MPPIKQALRNVKNQTWKRRILRSGFSPRQEACSLRPIQRQYGGRFGVQYPPSPPANGRRSSITVFEVCDRLNQPLRYHCFGSMFGFDLWPGTLSEVHKIIFTLNIPVCCTRPHYKMVITAQQHCSLRFMRLVTLGRWHWGRNVGWGCLENRVLRRIFGPKDRQGDRGVEKAA